MYTCRNNVVAAKVPTNHNIFVYKIDFLSSNVKIHKDMVGPCWRKASMCCTEVYCVRNTTHGRRTGNVDSAGGGDADDIQQRLRLIP